MLPAPSAHWQISQKSDRIRVVFIKLACLLLFHGFLFVGLTRVFYPQMVICGQGNICLTRTIQNSIVEFDKVAV